MTKMYFSDAKASRNYQIVIDAVKNLNDIGFELVEQALNTDDVRIMKITNIILSRLNIAINNLLEVEL